MTWDADAARFTRPADAFKDVRATYTNWKGETSVRWFLPLELFWGSTEWHPEPQWLLRALDLDKNEERTFAMKDMKDWKACAADK